MRITAGATPGWIYGGDTGVFSLGSPTCHGAYEAYNFQLYAATSTTGIATLDAASLVGGAYSIDGTHHHVRLYNATGVNSATASIVIASGTVTTVTLTSSGDGYASTDVLSFEIPASSGVICTTPASIDVATLGITGYSMINHSLYYDPVGKRWVLKDEDHNNILFSFSPDDKSKNCCPSKLNSDGYNYGDSYGPGATFTNPSTGVKFNVDEEFWVRHDANAIYNDTTIYMSEGACDDETDCDDLFSCKDSNFLKKQNNELAEDVAEIRDLEIFGFGGGGFDWDSLIKRNMVIHSLRCMPYGVLSDAETDCLKNKLTDKCNC